MHSNDQYLLEFLEQPHQLTIPIYQRKYSWNEKQCQQLLDDIERIGEANEKDTHFLGAIVFKSKYEKISKKCTFFSFFCFYSYCSYEYPI